MNSGPTIKKAKSVSGKSLRLSDVTFEDAELIVNLRTSERAALNLSDTSVSVSAQRDWISAYMQRPYEAYFVISTLDGTPIGTVRLYDGQGNSFCWGSWIIKPGAPASAAIESANLVYQYALDALGFCDAHFQVRKSNARVWTFHERYGAQRGSSDGESFNYTINNKAIRESLRRYARYSTTNIIVEQK